MPRLESDPDEVVTVSQRAAQVANLRHVASVVIEQRNPNRPPSVVVEWVPKTEAGELVHVGGTRELRVRNASRVAGLEEAIETFLVTVVPLMAAHKKANPTEGDNV